jgi:hypothetical protein
VLVTDKLWHQFATAIDLDVSIANQTQLPGGHSLRFGFQMAIDLVLSSVAGPTTREIRADLRGFFENISNANRAMRPETREILHAQLPSFVADLGEALERVLADLDETDQDASSSKPTNPTDSFLSNIIWLVGHCPAIRKSLPSKGHYEAAGNYPLYRSTRVAIDIACYLAERHAPAAAPKLKKIRNCQQSTLVNKLLRARRQISNPYFTGPVIE